MDPEQKTKLSQEDIEDIIDRLKLKELRAKFTHLQDSLTVLIEELDKEILETRRERKIFGWVSILSLSLAIALYIARYYWVG